MADVESHLATGPTPSYRAIPINADGTMKVENSGSVARDHLANERTFLAWLRTAI